MLQIAMVLADFTGAEAEELRRALSFHRSQERMQRVEKKLRAAMERKGHSPQLIDEVANTIGSFALYGFPESHAISFAHLAYASAYLKAHRAPEFYASLLNNQPMGFYSPATLIKDGQRHGVRFLPVCVLRSEWDCAIEMASGRPRSPLRAAVWNGDARIDNTRRAEDCAPCLLIKRTNVPAADSVPLSRPTGLRRAEAVWAGQAGEGGGEGPADQEKTSRSRPPESEYAIRLGLRVVRGLSRTGAERLLSARRKRPFTSLADFKQRAGLNKDELRTLAEIGALNGFAAHRRHALWQVEKPVREMDLFENPSHAPGQTADASPAPTDSPLAPMDYAERIRADFSGMQLTAGAHPMALLRPRLAGVWRAGDLPNATHGATVRIAGNVICRQRPGTAKGFVFISLEDETGVSNAVVTPPMFEAHRLLITEEPFLLIEGRLQHVDNVIHVKAERIERLPHGLFTGGGSYDFH